MWCKGLKIDSKANLIISWNYVDDNEENQYE